MSHDVPIYETANCMFNEIFSFNVTLQEWKGKTYIDLNGLSNQVMTNVRGYLNTNFQNQCKDQYQERLHVFQKGDKHKITLRAPFNIILTFTRQDSSWQVQYLNMSRPASIHIMNYSGGVEAICKGMTITTSPPVLAPEESPFGEYNNEFLVSQRDDSIAIEHVNNKGFLEVRTAGAFISTVKQTIRAMSGKVVVHGPNRVDPKVPNSAKDVRAYIEAYRKKAKQLWSAPIHTTMPEFPWPNSDAIESRLLNEQGLRKPKGAAFFVQQYSRVRDLYARYGATSRVAAIGEAIMYVLLRDVKHTAAAGTLAALGARQVYKRKKKANERRRS